MLPQIPQMLEMTPYITPFKKKRKKYLGISVPIHRQVTKTGTIEQCQNRQGIELFSIKCENKHQQDTVRKPKRL